MDLCRFSARTFIVKPQTRLAKQLRSVFAKSGETRFSREKQKYGFGAQFTCQINHNISVC